MNWLSHLNQRRRDSPLAVRLLAYILLFSSLITLLSTALQVYFEYRNDLSVINDRIQQLEATSLDNLANAMWLINSQQIETQLHGLYQLADMLYLQVDTQFDERFSAGTPPRPDTPLISRNYTLKHTTPEGEQYPLGTLQLDISLERVYQHLKEQVLVILATQAVKTFLVSIFILYIFWNIVTRHLGSLSRYAAALTLDRLEQPLTLKRRQRRPDELSQVVNAINSMRLSLLDDIDKRQQAEQALSDLNEQLEARVTQRTRELEQINGKLNHTLEQLQGAQAQLVESERLAALGGLVAGVAHEINTPLGIGLTAATYMRDQSALQLDNHRRLDGDALVDFRDMTRECCDLIVSNLQRAARLVSAFKQVSVDQSSEQRRNFDLGEYLQEILQSLAPLLKKSAPEISIRCPAGLILCSYPGAFYQIISNLIQNSLIHGFGEQRGGHIWIEVTEQDHTLVLEYRDDGVGIDSQLHSKVFDPFYTTGRNLGCSGLGLHIAYNLVSQLLQGRLRCLPPGTDQGNGARFQIELPNSHRLQPLGTTSA